ncbi:UNVERIFIED_CONTAM: Transcription factor bHLH19, partial [Sesamum indicum]
MKEENFGEIFGVNKADDDEIFTSHHNFSINTTNQQLQYSEYPPACWNNSCTMQQTMTTTNVASSSASTSASACQLIYVESKNVPVPVLHEESLVSSVDRAASTFHDQFVISPSYGLSANNLSSNTILNFSSPAVLVKDDSIIHNIKNPQYEYDLGTNGKHSWNRVNSGSVGGRSRLQAREHLVAERKRREKLGQLFINLSKLVPGIKK